MLVALPSQKCGMWRKGYGQLHLASETVTVHLSEVYHLISFDIGIHL